MPPRSAASGAASKTFKTNLAESAKVTASNVRGKSRTFRAENLLDGSRETYWATDDGVALPEVVLDFGRPTAFNIVRLRENVRLGQRIDSVALDAWQNDAWQEIGQATSIGPCRLIRTPTDITAARIRLRVVKAAAAPALSELAVFRG